MRPAASPRLSDTVIARYPAATEPPRPHTDADLDRLLHMLHTATAWVIADTPAGTAQLTARMAECDGWSATRTLGFASVASPELISLTGARLSGMTGATSDGDGWLIGEDDFVVEGRRPAAVHR